MQFATAIGRWLDLDACAGLRDMMVQTQEAREAGV